MYEKGAVVFVHGVGPSEEGDVFQSFVQGEVERASLDAIESSEGQSIQEKPDINGRLDKLYISGDTYTRVSLSNGLSLIESSWSEFRPVRTNSFSTFFEALALLWGTLQLATHRKIDVGNEERQVDRLGQLYVWFFVYGLFWCIHPAIISLFFTTGDIPALFMWISLWAAVVWLLGRFDKDFLWGFAWIAASLFLCLFVVTNHLDEENLVAAGAWIYLLVQGATLMIGFVYLVTQLFLRSNKEPISVLGTRLALVYIPFFAASGIGALAWTLALGRAQTTKGSVTGHLTFDKWAEVYERNIETVYPVFNAEMYNGLSMFVVGCILIFPPLYTFFKTKRSSFAEKTGEETRRVFSRCLFASGFVVVVAFLLFFPAMIYLHDMSGKFIQADAPGGEVFLSYALWSVRVVPFLPLFVGPLALVFKILGDVVFYLLPSSDQVVAREKATQKLNRLLIALTQEGYTVLVVSHSQGTMIALDAVDQMQREDEIGDSVGLWLSGSPSVALYSEFLKLHRLSGCLPNHLRNFYREDDVISASIKERINGLDKRKPDDFLEISWGSGGHINYWKDFRLADLQDGIERIDFSRQK